jgi:hypothetical protein
MACTPPLVQAAPGLSFGTGGSFPKCLLSWVPGQTNPRYQTGLRYSPTKDIDWDVIYGRNLLGEGLNWITIGLTVRIDN